MQGPETLKRGFTLVEVLVVLSVIVILAALALPVFSRIRSQAHSTTCQSNLRQIGVSILLYAHDNDDKYPNGADPADKFTSIWDSVPNFKSRIQNMPLLPIALKSYNPTPSIWQCPSDTGFTELDSAYTGGLPIPLLAKPSLYQAYGASYFGRTEIALQNLAISSLSGEITSKNLLIGPDAINILMDAHGRWHGGNTSDATKRFNVLFADGHIKTVPFVVAQRYWDYSLITPLPHTAPPSLDLP